MTDENTGGAEAETVETLTAKVEHWKAQSRKNEDRASANAAAVTELASLKASQDTAITTAKAEVEATIPTKVAETLRDSLVSLGVVTDEDKVLLTASDPEQLLAQAKRLIARSGEKDPGNRAPLAGKTGDKAAETPMRVLTNGLFKRDN